MLKRQRGFTLIELLVVLAIIGILIGLVSLNVSLFTRKAQEVGTAAELEIVQKAVWASMTSNGLVAVPTAECIEDLSGSDLALWPDFSKQRYPGGGRAYSWDTQGNVVLCGDSVPRIEASYWNNRTLSGAPTLQRIEQEIHHDWDYGSPDPSIPENQFSARWRWPITIHDSGLYAFTTITDDGVRLYLDGVPILDYWVYQAVKAHSVQVDVPIGSHELVMEYFEGNGHAVAKLDWVKVDSP